MRAPSLGRVSVAIVELVAGTLCFAFLLSTVKTWGREKRMYECHLTFFFTLCGWNCASLALIVGMGQRWQRLFRDNSETMSWLQKWWAGVAAVNAHSTGSCKKPPRFRADDLIPFSVEAFSQDPLRLKIAFPFCRLCILTLGQCDFFWLRLLHFYERFFWTVVCEKNKLFKL